MANSPGKNMTEQEMETTMLDNDDDITVATATTATKTDFIGHEMADHNIHFEIAYRKGQANYADFKLHAQLLQVLTKAFDDTDITKIKRLRILLRKNGRIQRIMPVIFTVMWIAHSKKQLWLTASSQKSRSPL